MTRYRVHLLHGVSTSVEVDAPGPANAAALGEEGNLPTPGWQIGADYEASGEWEAVAVEDVATGEQVWADYPSDREHALRTEVDQLRARVAQLEAIERHARAITTELAVPSASLTTYDRGRRDAVNAVLRAVDGQR